MSITHDVLRRALLGASLVVIVLPALAEQRGSESRAGTANAQVTASDQAVLNERNRERMHPGDPLNLVGVEQQGNDVRSRTPALARSDRVAACVDADENYQRTLAMYETGATFHMALRAAPGLASENRSRPQTPGVNAPIIAGDEVKSEVRGGWPWGLAIGALVLAGLWSLGRSPRNPI